MFQPQAGQAERRAVVVGAGVGGLVSALLLADQGVAVTVVEKEAGPGGKLRAVEVGGRPLDAGPTVFTMRWVFDELFQALGLNLNEHLKLQRADVLARHAWDPGERLDLFADTDRSADAIAAFAGPAEAAGYRAFAARARDIYETLAPAFIAAQRPSPPELVRRVGLTRLPALWRISPFQTLWGALGSHFKDPRLRQLFGRYATYCGSSPFHAPATLMLVAHVEKEGVHLVEAGMHRLAEVLEGLARERGVTFRYGAVVAELAVSGGKASGVRLASGEAIQAEAVVFNGDSGALPALLGKNPVAAARRVPARDRSLSAITWLVNARAEGFPLSRHTVFFSRDYRAEFDDILSRGRPPADPTIYICAQDRGAADEPAPDRPERLLCLINAPAAGDARGDPSWEIEACTDRLITRLQAQGLRIDRAGPLRTTTPTGFERLYPMTGGALYGRASHGWMASFSRPGARSRLPGLYLAGGSVHPGPGVPMAALSGRLAAESLLADWASTPRFRPAGIGGGTSTASATTAGTR